MIQCFEHIVLGFRCKTLAWCQILHVVVDEKAPIEFILLCWCRHNPFQYVVAIMHQIFQELVSLIVPGQVLTRANTGTYLDRIKRWSFLS